MRPKRNAKNAPRSSRTLLCVSHNDDPLDPDPIELRDLRDEICRALDAYYALGGCGLIAEVELAEHVNPPQAWRCEPDVRRSIHDLHETIKVAYRASTEPRIQPVPESEVQSLTGVAYIANRINCKLQAEDIENQARRARLKAKERADSGKKHNADLVVSLGVRWCLLSHLGAVKKDIKDFFGILYDTEIVPCDRHAWLSLLGGMRISKAPPYEKHAEEAARLRKLCIEDPPGATNLVAQWFGTSIPPAAKDEQKP